MTLIERLQGLEGCEDISRGHCEADDCDCYPNYGVAPHECYWRKPGGFEENPLGTSTIIDPDKWPDNFLAEIDQSEPIEQQISWGLCGVYYCPRCKHGMEETATLWGPQKILAAQGAGAGGMSAFSAACMVDCRHDVMYRR